MNKNKRPSWRVCYLTCMVMIGLLWLDYHVASPGIAQKSLACAIVVGWYILVSRWLRANRTAFIHEAWSKEERRTPTRTQDADLTPVQEHYNRVMKRYGQQRT